MARTEPTNEFTTASDIAREALRQLAANRIVPTPDNYRDHYERIAGTASDCGSDSGTLPPPSAAAWVHVLHSLMKGWETYYSGLTQGRKREQLDRILRNPGADPNSLAAKLQRTLDSWADMPQAAPFVEAAPEAAPPLAGSPPQTAGRPVPPTSDRSAKEREEMLGQLRELLAQTLEFAVISQLSSSPELNEEANRLAQAARATTDRSQLAGLTSSLKQFWFKLELHSGDDVELHQGLLRLLRLLIDNTHELLNGDQWLRGQIEVVKEIVSRPLNQNAINDAERRLKDVLIKQGLLGASLQEAKLALKNMITGFIDRLGELSESTAGYQDKLEGYSRKIRDTDDIRQLNAVVGELLEDTRTASIATGKTRDELIQARKQVFTAEARVKQLESELEHVSELVHEDDLTGVLNRRGLDEAHRREISRADRSGRPLSISLLDIDNFKRLNDTFGHQAGDDALQHLVRVVKRTMRPSDVLARYGGEEFLLLLPETDIEEAVSVMVRLQRNLTKAFFLHNNERVLITFSAGVALRQPGEAPTATIERADQALYKAKRAGKNQVCSE